MAALRGELLGRRVVLRRRAGVRDGRVVYTDLLGELVGISGGFLTVRLEDGSTATVAEDDVHRLRPVPPGRAAIEALEEVAARGWPAPETARLGGWLLRAGAGWTRRANSALLLGDPGVPVPDALAQVRAWYAERGLPAVLAAPLPPQAAADRTAHRLGWTHEVDTEVLTRPLAPGAAADPGVLLSPDLPPGWDLVYRSRGVPPVGRQILTAPPTVTFATVLDGGAPVAVGRGVVTDGWLGVAAVEVLPAYRRRGLARQVMTALAAWGAQHGARRCYLQVEAVNAPALALYARLGFTRHHRYRHRRLG